MSTGAPPSDDVLERVETLGQPGTPVTTPEVAEGFDCTQRTIYNRLESLVDDGVLQTKKVGANSRVWWQPADGDVRLNDRAVDQGPVSLRDEQAPSFVADSEMAERIREFEWADTPLGPIDEWPSELRVAVDIMLGADEAIGIYWGAELTLLYNDAWRELIGEKHPEALGWPAEDVFPEIWETIEPRFASVLDGNGSVVEREQHLPLNRGGSLEDAWFNYSTNPIPLADGTVGGILNIAIEVTERKEAELELQHRAELDAFRLELTDAIRPLSDPQEVQSTAAHVVGEKLDVNSAHYGEVLADENTNIVHADYYHSGVASFAGRHELDNYGSYIPESFRAGETVVIDDFSTLDELSEAERALYDQSEIAAWIGVPLVKDDRLVGYFVVTESTPREWTDTEVEIMEETAERTWAAVERTNAERAREATAASLQRLNDAARELIDADVASVADRIAPLVRDVLEVDYAVLWRYDDQRGEVAEYAADTAPDLDGTVQFPGEIADQVWETFVGTGIDVANDLDVPADDPTPLRSRAFVPVGRHGVICLGSTMAETFDERTVDLVETVAATVETTWDRAEGEHRLEAQNQELQRVDHLNTLIREIDQALVGADAREAIEEAVCEQLTSSEQYGAAWLTSYDAETDTLRPQTWAGVDSGYLESRTLTVEDASSDDPAVAAHRTRELQVVADIAVDARAASWREAALEQGARSCIAIPLDYGESLYGVLTVYRWEPQPDERETEVLAELGGTIAHAINAVETKETLQTDSVVELTIQTTANTPLSRLARDLDCEITFEGFVSGADDGATVYFSIADVQPAAVLDATTGPSALRDLTTIVEQGDDGTSLFRATVTEPTIPSLLVEEAVVVRSLTVGPSAATAVVDVFRADHVGDVLDTLRESLSGVELLARRTERRSPETRGTFRQKVEDRLTPRQHEVLLTAYRSGFFQSPRPQTGAELADVLDISPPTFTHHLRESQRRLCELVFDPA